MKKMMVLMILSLSASVAQADLSDSLRELNSTVNEMSRTGKELGAISEQASTQNGQTQASKQASGELKSGDVLRSKISKVKVFKEPSKKSDKADMVSKSDDMIFMGEEANGFYKVTTNNSEGWVEKLLVQRAN